MSRKEGGVVLMSNHGPRGEILAGTGVDTEGCSFSSWTLDELKDVPNLKGFRPSNDLESIVPDIAM